MTMQKNNLQITIEIDLRKQKERTNHADYNV